MGVGLLALGPWNLDNGCKLTSDFKVKLSHRLAPLVPRTQNFIIFD